MLYQLCIEDGQCEDAREVLYRHATLPMILCEDVVLHRVCSVLPWNPPSIVTHSIPTAGNSGPHTRWRAIHSSSVRTSQAASRIKILSLGMLTV